MKKINEKIWIYAEKIYIKCCGVNKFIELVEENNIPIDEYDYNHLDLESFYIANDYSKFVRTMLTEDQKKYLPFLQKIFFEDKIITLKDSKNNDEFKYVKNWYQEIIKILKDERIIIDEENKELYFIPIHITLFNYRFDDLFIDKIIKEINECYDNGQYLAILLLTRKIIEVVLFYVLKKIFPRRLINGVENVDSYIWYDSENKRAWNMDRIIENIKSNSIKFDDDKNRIKDLCSFIKPIKDEINTYMHRDYKFPNKSKIDDFDIPSLLFQLRIVYKFYCK